MTMETDNARELGFAAYQYFYPLVIMDVTRRQATNVAGPGLQPMKAPVNRFAHFRAFPTADARDVVRFNFDTLYSFAWLDLRDEPIVLTVPDSGGRYYLVPMLDMWSDVFSVPGSRTTGGQERHFAVAASGWSGELPDGVDLIEAPTPVVWVMGRIQVNGPDDLPAVHALQEGLRTVPLSKWGTDFRWPAATPVDPTVDDVTPPLHQVNAMEGLDLIRYGVELLAVHEPRPFDHPIIEQLRAVGVTPGEPFAAESLDADIRDALAAGAKDALQDLVASATDGSLGVWENGWGMIKGGSYGTDYRLRAMVALAGLGCNLPEDALYPGTKTDDQGRPLTGAHRYVLRFEPGELPPADAFWSLTMYDAEGFQVPNPINRFAIGDRDPMVYGDDGSLEILIQAASPGAAREANWLPAPEGEFQPLLRIYSPAPSALRRGVTVPAIRRVES